MKPANAAFFCLIEQTGLELKLGNVINVFKISQTNVLHCMPATWQLAACVVQKCTTQINPEQHRLEADGCLQTWAHILVFLYLV